ncbi:diacylglycerol kinase family protein [Draconibacterium sp. IB214405]|uniref:diacylglycerol kinase family protein n=1 Tax=Draconibacterium sp. IB214405 TaxID=3097352 RepID=UPI002A14322F|nr:diacylglycerol kinase family protein [Draconibacterium sp. IB214405]MDX8340399.1 diacylglycerol kinase family protein [Draconibacterium sp. IB214405]
MKNVFIEKRLLSFKHAFNGIRHLWKNEINFRIHILTSTIVIALAALVEITRTKWLLIFICVGIVLAAEVFNSAIERICNFVSPEKNTQIKIIKDISAAAVLIVSVRTAIIGAFIFC